MAPKRLTPSSFDHVQSRLAFSDRWLKNRTAADVGRDFRDTVTRGLIARVLPSSAVQFSIRYRVEGKQRRFVLGDYPALRLAQARVKASRTLLDVRDGRDPSRARKAARARPTDTVAALVADYLRRHAVPNKRTAAEDERALTVEVLPTWRDRSVRSLTRRDVRGLIEGVVDRGSPVMANRLLAVIRKMLNFAVDHDWIDANPAARLKKPTREHSRERVLTDEEIRRVWRLLSNLPTTADRPAPGRSSKRRKRSDDPLCPVSAPLAAMLKVRLLTAQRGGEVARMRWADVDLDAGWWTIPGADTKNGEPHRVPLTADVVDLIRHQEKDDRDADAFVFVGYGASVLDRAKKAPAVIARTLGIDFRGHDLRRTAATRMAATGVPREHIGRVLNHVEGGARATRVYDRHSYDGEKRAALDAWASSLSSVLENKPRRGAAVVPIRRSS